jgi:hypothetical protein
MPRWVEEGFDDDHDEDEELVPCPYCRAEIHEESVRCPRCGKYISLEDSPGAEPDDGEDDQTIPCPYCGEDVYEEAEQCPQCGNYISAEDAPAERKPWWLIVGVVTCLLVMYFWIFG